MTDEAKVQIGGDNAALKKMLAEAQSMLNAFAKKNAGALGGGGLGGGGGGGGGGGAHGGSGGFGTFAMHALEVFTGMGALRTVEGALHALKEAMMEAIHASAELERSQVRLDVLFRNSEGVGFFKDQLEDMNEEIHKSTGFSGTQIRNSQAVFLKLGQIQGEVFKRGLDASADLAAFMGTDMPQAAESLGRALQNPVQGMLLLSRAGVRLTKAEKERIKNLQDSMQIEKARIALLDIVEKKFGGLAATMKRDTFVGMMSDLTSGIHEAYEEVGKRLLPSLKEMMPALKGILELVKNIGLGLAGLAKPITITINIAGGMVEQLRKRRDEINDLVLDTVYGGSRADRERALKRQETDEEIINRRHPAERRHRIVTKTEWDAASPEAQKAMRAAAEAEGFKVTPEKGKIEQQPTGRSLQGTFEGLEDTWKRISGSSKDTNESIEKLQEATEKGDQANIDATKEQTTQLINSNRELIAEMQKSIPPKGAMA